DAFPADAPAAMAPDGAQRDAYLNALAAHLRPVMERARHEGLAQAEFRESVYSQFETAANRWLEVERARREGAAPRMQRGVLRPIRPAERTDLVARPLPGAVVDRELAAARAAAAAYAARLGELYRYNLITRNCVSEVFATIAAGLARDGSGADAARES